MSVSRSRVTGLALAGIHSLYFAVKFHIKINRKRDRALAVGGHHLAEQRNNQLLVDITGKSCIREEMRPGWNM
jgi:hypothetical protein